MASQVVNQERMMIALGKVEGFPFEAFVNSFFSSLLGKDFVPLGGVKDGGADGFQRFISADASGKYYMQASIRMDAEAKIRETIARLREVGRNPVQLYYVTSKPVKSVDMIEDRLTSELNVTIRIRDSNYLISHVNDTIGTQAAYNQHLDYLTASLDNIGSSNVVTPSEHVRDPSVFVFLTQELDRRNNSNDQTLVSDVVDSLILWALEGTDPDQKKLMSEKDVLEKILSVLPSVANLVKPRLKKRLVSMSSKSPSGRTVRRYKKTEEYCLPYETRQDIQKENQSDEALRTTVKSSIEERILKNKPAGLGDVGIERTVETIMRTLQLTFELQGLTFISSLHSDDQKELVVMSDSLEKALDEAGINGQSRVLIGETAFECLRGILYESTDEEREYLHKLSRTYALLFTLNSEPKLIDFFNRMAGDFELFVGSDQIVRALSEVCLAQGDRVVTNTLKMSAQAGAKLILTEAALDEIVYHLRACDHEFQNTFASIEEFVPYDIVRNSPKIMVRAYMYSKLSERKDVPTNWPSFINQFCTYQRLHRQSSFAEIRKYLQHEFSMSYIPREELRSMVDESQLTELSATLEENGSKKSELAENDALMVLSVYGHRRKNHEYSSISEFGYQTWWLTGETRVLKHTRDLVTENNDGLYIMRPDFLLNFLTLAPAAQQAREAFSTIFPSLLGVTLSRRMAEAPFKEMIERVRDAQKLSDARRAVVIADYADQLKGDLQKQYARVQSDSGEKFSGIDSLAQQYWDVND